jgi:hypothetical protein
MATIELSGKVTNEKATDLEGLTVQLYTASNWEAAGSASATDTTDSNGLWNFDSQAEGTYITVVHNADSTKKFLFDGRNEVQFTNVDVRSSLQVNTINEATSGSGVTIDSLLVKDGGLVFEGATADAHETTLAVVDATADATINLPAMSAGTYYVPVLAAASTTAVSSTPAELNLLDGSSANSVVNSKAVIYGSSGELAGTLSTAAQTNITSLGALAAGSIACGFGAIDNGTSDITSGGTWTVDVDATGTDGTGLSAAGTLRMGASQDLRIYHGGSHNYITGVTGDLVITTDGGSAAGIILDAEDDTIEIKYSGTVGATFGTGGLNLASGDAFSINCASVLNATTLGSNVVSSSLTSVGTLGALTVDDVAINGKVVTMTGSACDTIVMTAATNGAFSLVTTDTAAAAANIQITADGTVDIDSAGVLTLDSGAAINIEPASGSAVLIDGTVSIDGAAITGATSILATDIKIGEDDETKVDFADANIINLHANNIKALSVHNTSSKGELRFYEGANYVGFAAPALSADQVWALPTADGSCGQVLSTNGSGALSWAAAGGPTEAVETDMENEGSSNANRYVSPEIAKHHPGVAKGWVFFQVSSGTPCSPTNDYNVDCITNGDPGVYTINWTTSFSGSNYAMVALSHVDMIHAAFGAGSGNAADCANYQTYNNCHTLADSVRNAVVAFGAQ